MSERRSARRSHGVDLAAQVRPGQRVRIVDVSAGGALFDALRPLRPGASVEVQFERADSHVWLSATVLRCGVVAIDPHYGPTYRAAVSFNQTFAWAWEAPTRGGYRVPDSEARGEVRASESHK